MKSDAITRLCEIVPPPNNVSYNIGYWNAIESELGLQLPTDYKQMIEVFGDGVFRGHEFRSGIHIASYFGPMPAKKRAVLMGEYLRMLDLEFNMYPDIPGLLYLGEYKDVDLLTWNTNGSPDEWSIVYIDVETGAHEIKGMGIVDLLVLILEESSPLQPHVIGVGEMAGPHTFGP